MGQIGELWVKIGAKTDDFNKGLSDMDKATQKIGKKLSSVGKTLTLGITLPLVAAGGAAIKLAMDAVESENLFEVSMGKMAGAARKWSEKLRKELGLNSYEVRKNIATFNVMLDSMGLSEQAAYDMAKGLTQLSYDMASFYNLKPEEAFLKLQSGISGEIEPLKRLGILVNENTIKHYALKTGLIKAGETMTEQQKVMARYAVIVEQTSKAQGDLARTLDSPTNKLRILKARITELGIEMGTKLLPTFEKMLKRIDSAVTWFSNLSNKTKSLIVKIGGLLAALGPVLIIVGKLLIVVPKLGRAFKGLGGPIAIVVAGLALITKKAIEAKKEFEKSMRLYRREMELTGTKTSWFMRTLGSVQASWNKTANGIDTNKIALVAYERAQQRVNGIMTIAKAAAVGVSDAFSWLGNKLDGLIDKLPKVASGVGAVASAAIDLSEDTGVLIEKTREYLGVTGDLERGTIWSYEVMGKAVENFRDKAMAATYQWGDSHIEVVRNMENVLNQAQEEMGTKTLEVAKATESTWTSVSEELKAVWVRELGDMILEAKSFKEGIENIFKSMARIVLDTALKDLVEGFTKSLKKMATSAEKNVGTTAAGAATKAGGGILSVFVAFAAYVTTNLIPHITNAFGAFFDWLSGKAEEFGDLLGVWVISEKTKKKPPADWVNEKAKEKEERKKRPDGGEVKKRVPEESWQKGFEGILRSPVIAKMGEIPEYLKVQPLSQYQRDKKEKDSGGTSFIINYSPHIVAMDSQDVQRFMEGPGRVAFERMLDANVRGITRRLKENTEKY